jgi:chromosome segregation ATPase
MGNEAAKGLSVNAKTLIMILLFVNVGFAFKMINKYYAMKEAGYIREKTFHEQLQKRVMKAFGSMEELNKMVNDMTRQKEDAEKLAASFKAQGEQLKVANKNLEEAKAKLEEEKARLQKEIWELEDSLSLARKTLSSKDSTIHELMGNLEKVEKENAELKRQIEEHSKTPGAWSLPKQ